jgi:hypothetical protein
MFQSVRFKEIFGKPAAEVTFDASMRQRKVLVSISATTSTAIYETAKAAVVKDRIR